VARKAVILVEPIYELAPEEAQKRMDEHGYVRNLKVTAEQLAAKVIEYGLLEQCINPLNPSGVVALVKTGIQAKKNVTSISFQGSVSVHIISSQRRRSRNRNNPRAAYGVCATNTQVPEGQGVGVDG
jgi:hypothetical protein